MSTLVDAIATHLVNAGVVSTGWAVDKLGAQDTPETTITIYETGGPEAVGKNKRIKRPTFQVVTRAGPNGRQAASLKAHAILAALDGANVSGFGMFIAAGSGPASVGPDERGRPMFAVNFRAML